MPTLQDAVPTVEKYRYVRADDQIVEARRQDKARQSEYADVVAKAVLRRIHEAFAGDPWGLVDVVTLNAYIDTIDPSSGLHVRPCVASLRTTRTEFSQLNLAKVEAAACLKKLNAAVSRSPAELVAVKPVMVLDMADPRFIKEADVLSTLDNRPNLMDLTPGEFENPITNLFQRRDWKQSSPKRQQMVALIGVAYDAVRSWGQSRGSGPKRYKHECGRGSARCEIVRLTGAQRRQVSKGILGMNSDSAQRLI